MTFQLIGAGFGRTGTNSMKLALPMLGLGPCHHMTVLLDNPDQKMLWRSYANGGATNWDEAFAGFGAAVDWPSAYYWKDIANHFPLAKVLLTLRSAESWWNSYSKTIGAMLAGNRGDGSWGDTIIAGRIMQGKPLDRDTAIAAFNANTAKVRGTVPAARLIVHEVGDGWGPLCAGLALPIPDVDYPSTNSTSDFNANLADRNAEE